MQIAANSVQLVSGGNVIKQGDETPLVFRLSNELGEVVDLQGATVNVKIANNKAVVLEKVATVTAENTLTFSLTKDDVTGHGNMQIGRASCRERV